MAATSPAAMNQSTIARVIGCLDSESVAASALDDAAASLTFMHDDLWSGKVGFSANWREEE
jgi:hypothetical protein